jgi:hypothetical protein
MNRTSAPGAPVVSGAPVTPGAPATAAGSAAAVGAVLILVGLLLALFGRSPSAADSALRPTHPATARPSAAAGLAGPSPTPASVTDPGRSTRAAVVVFNQTRLRGLGARFAERLRAEGWPVQAVDTWRGNVPASTVYHPPRLAAAAERLAADHPEIIRRKPAFAGLPADSLTVILTDDVSAAPDSSPEAR